VQQGFRDFEQRGLGDMTDNSVLQARARFWKVAGAVIAAVVVLSTTGTHLDARHEASFVATNLGTIHDNGIFSVAFAVSANGVVVGRSAIDGNQDVFHAFVWTADTRMVDLGTLQMGTQNTASLIGDNRVIAGFGFLDEKNDAAHAFVRTHATGVVELALTGGSHSGPSAINAKGDVVGFSDSMTDSRTNPAHAFLWTARDGIQDLGTLGGATSEAHAISDDGVVVGLSVTAPPDNFPHAFRWTRHEGMVDLGTLGGLNSTANGVNNDGVIVGTSDIDPTSVEQHAFVWTRRTGMFDIGKDGFTSFGEQINGRFVIGHFTSNNTTHGFVWTEKRGFVDIGTLPGDVGSLVVGVNDRGVVAGNSFSESSSRAFVWSRSSGIVQLETPAGGSSQANAMNGDFIVGSSCDAHLTCHATLWKPSPHSRKDRDRDDDGHD